MTMLVFNKNLSACTAWWCGNFLTIVIACSNGDGNNSLVRMLRTGRKECDALGTKPRGICGILLVGTDHDGAVG